MDGTLIVYDKRITDNKNVLEEFNNIYCTLNFTTVEENENSLNSLDVTLKRMENHINLMIFRKLHKRMDIQKTTLTYRYS
jgi:hypothetical protein